jgi:hypothetical protein
MSSTSSSLGHSAACKQRLLTTAGVVKSRFFSMQSLLSRGLHFAWTCVHSPGSMTIFDRGEISGAATLSTNSNFVKAGKDHLYTSSVHLLFYMNASFGPLGHEPIKSYVITISVC